MKTRSVSWPLLGACVALTGLLTACPGKRPPSDDSLSLRFSLPEGVDRNNLWVAALYYPLEEGGAVGKPVMVGSTPASYSGAANGDVQMYLSGYVLRQARENAKCTTRFLTGEASGKQAVSVTPDTALTCKVEFVAYTASSAGTGPTLDSLKYTSNDLYSFASEAFKYSFVNVNADGTRSTETGTRTAGWSLVRREVLNPSATPQEYLVTMNSVLTADQAVAVKLREPRDPYKSQGLAGGRQ
ncbi:hypothetical protein [Deinococcus sp. Leaf326]|uniref:hypothetical protein n=1 Tax=Deinococcus sp. Leaf326 TaxID=1736338 RepID=UPI0006FC6087|nr:hypothetical protein [Deinococcus sp. Leaf326]KQR04779.1 hypothetical protein ASF71_12280 [Deinococcus sp. Leaf326]